MSLHYSNIWFCATSDHKSLLDSLILKPVAFGEFVIMSVYILSCGGGAEAC